MSNPDACFSPRGEHGFNRINESLVGIGLTFSRDKSKGNYVVKRLVGGGSASKSHKIQQGDVFLEVDGLSVNSLNPEDLCRFFISELRNNAIFLIFFIQAHSWEAWKYH